MKGQDSSAYRVSFLKGKGGGGQNDNTWVALLYILSISPSFPPFAACDKQGEKEPPPLFPPHLSSKIPEGGNISVDLKSDITFYFPIRYVRVQTCSGNILIKNNILII
jgi:hypothetical protein